MWLHRKDEILAALIAEGVLDETGARLCTLKAQSIGANLRAIVAAHSGLKEADIEEHVASFLGIPFCREPVLCEPEPRHAGILAERGALCIRCSESATTYAAAVSDPFDLSWIASVKREGAEVPAVLVPSQTFEKLACACESARSRAAGVSPDANDKVPDEREVLEKFLFRASAEGASDVYLETRNSRGFVRYRVNGSMRPGPRLEPEAWSEALFWLKSRARLQTGDRRPQDGRLELGEGAERCCFRVASASTREGDMITLRQLGAEQRSYDFESLQLQPEICDEIGSLFQGGAGAIVVSGPTGSGKTTTLYAMLEAFDTAARKTVSVEDPVERRIPGVVQIPVRGGADSGFDRLLRALLRHDPDTLLVGEVRDPETARTALQAAISGHLLLTTLHAGEAAAVPVRLVDLGCEAYLVRAALRIVGSQRLLRTICSHCHGSADAFPSGSFDVVQCSHCLDTGFGPRVSISEYVGVTDFMLDGLGTALTIEMLRDRFRSAGMKTLTEACNRLVEQGRVSEDEIRRVLGTHFNLY